MKLTHFIVAAAATFLISTNLGWAQGSSGVDRLYILDCGQGHAPDQSRWSPGVNVGVPIDVVDNCYLIHHLQGYFLWDTGIADQVADMPNGIGGIAGAPSWRRPKKLADQLAAIGVSPLSVLNAGTRRLSQLSLK